MCDILARLETVAHIWEKRMDCSANKSIERNGELRVTSPDTAFALKNSDNVSLVQRPRATEGT